METPDRPGEDDDRDGHTESGGGNESESGTELGATAATGSLLDTLRDRDARTLATTAAGLVVAITLLGLALRLLLLGDRIAHWDEGRVGYWIVHYAETGSFAYRRIIHGPFVQHVNRWLFPVLGANDYTMRLPVALISATLPLSALLFRKHLRRVEMAAMAFFLAANPVILYYSRFMRSDLLVATFMFLALGMLVRFYDSRRWRYVYVASALMACGFASKENAILYVLTWVGAVGLLADQALYRPREHSSGYHLLAAKGHVLIGTARVDGRWSVVRHPFHLVGVAVVFLAVGLFFYAPRGDGLNGLRHPAMAADHVVFWQAVADPTQLPALVEHTWAHVSTEYGEWFGQAGESGEQSIVSVYAEFLGRYVRVMGYTAAPLTVLSVVGFAYERYGRESSRNLVLLAAYCGFVSVLGYPLGTDIFGAWIVVHALVPLAIPAAVGLAVVFDWGREAFLADDKIGVTAAFVVLLVVGGSMAGVAAVSVYQNPQSDDNYLVQYAQPSDSPREELDAIRQVAANDSRSGQDVVLYYGEPDNQYVDREALVEKDPGEWNQSYFSYEPLCAKWFNTLPLPWYFASTDADVDCSRLPGEMTERIESNPPAVVITVYNNQGVPREALDNEYTRATHSMRTSGTKMVFWVHESVEIDRETDAPDDRPTRRGPNQR